MRRLIRKAVFAVGVAEIAGLTCYPLVAPGTQLAIVLQTPELKVAMCLLAVLAIALAADYAMSRPSAESSDTVAYPPLANEARGYSKGP